MLSIYLYIYLAFYLHVCAARIICTLYSTSISIYLGPMYIVQCISLSIYINVSSISVHLYLSIHVSMHLHLSTYLCIIYSFFFTHFSINFSCTASFPEKCEWIDVDTIVIYLSFHLSKTFLCIYAYLSASIYVY